MTRRKVLERILDERLAPVCNDLSTLVEVVAIDLAAANERRAVDVRKAEQRVTAATAQAAETVRHADARNAAALAAVRAELAAKVEETALVPWRELRRERDQLGDHLANTVRHLDEANGQIAHLEAEVERLTIERDEARRQHDEQRRVAQEWMEEWQSDAPALDLLAALLPAARAVLPDLEKALPTRPHGGSRTRAKARMEALAALVNPDDDTSDDTTSRAPTSWCCFANLPTIWRRRPTALVGRRDRPSCCRCPRSGVAGPRRRDRGLGRLPRPAPVPTSAARRRRHGEVLAMSADLVFWLVTVPAVVVLVRSRWFDRLMGGGHDAASRG